MTIGAEFAQRARQLRYMGLRNVNGTVQRTRMLHRAIGLLCRDGSCTIAAPANHGAQWPAHLPHLKTADDGNGG